MRIDLDSVECGSAFDIARDHAPADDIRSIGQGLNRVTLPDVLFLPHALKRGQCICLTAGQRLVPVEALLDCWSLDFLKQGRRKLKAPAYSDDFEVEIRDDEVCILGNLFSRNFGHWTEELLKVAVLEQAGSDCTYVIPTLPTFAQASLSFLGLDEPRVAVVDRPTIFTRAVFTTAVSHENVAQHPHALSLLRELVASRLADRAGGSGKRIWLERKEVVRNAGGTANAEEVRELIARYDFEIVDMAALSFGDQLQRAGAASVISGVHGSQFVHAQFMPPKSTVVECFSPTHVNPSILQICRALGHSYHQVVARSSLIAPYALGRDCQVDCEHLELVLDSLPR